MFFGALIYSGKDEGKILTKGKETELSVEIDENVFSD